MQTNQIQASTSTWNVYAYDAGWYDDSGYHNPNNDNYLAGKDCGFGCWYVRDWFVFSIPGNLGTIQGASLTIYTADMFSSTGNVGYELHEVTTPVATLLAGGSGLTAIY